MDKKKNFFSDMKEKWNGFMEKTRPGREKTGRVLSVAGMWIYRLRSLILGIPVGVAAVILALRNARSLPAQIALSIPKVEDGALVIVSQMLDKNVAVMGPLAITALCILMMFISKRMTYPFLISVFTLGVPIALYYMNCVLV